MLGRLSAHGITKAQFGKSKITRHKESKKPISLADDCKAAATDALKKCATLFGVGLHLYLEETAQRSPTPPKPARPTPRDGKDTATRLNAQQLSAIYTLGKKRKMTNAEIKAYTLKVFNKVPDFLTDEEARAIIKMLQEEKPNG